MHCPLTMNPQRLDHCNSCDQNAAAEGAMTRVLFLMSSFNEHREFQLDSFHLTEVMVLLFRGVWWLEEIVGGCWGLGGCRSFVLEVLGRSLVFNRRGRGGDVEVDGRITI